MLLVTGTSGNDVIVIEPRPSNRSQIRVRLNGRIMASSTTARFSGSRVSLAGHDTLVVNATLNKPAELHGNEGHDALFGGAAGDSLFGEDGHDSLFGSAGTIRSMAATGTTRCSALRATTSSWAATATTACLASRAATC